MQPPLVLSLFPGIDLLGRGFAAAGFCVVRGPDLMLDEQIEDFHGTPGFAGVIGGPPCVNYSDANRRRDTDEGDRLVRHFLRVVLECNPIWFLMENVRNVPDVRLAGYSVQRLDVVDHDFGGKQRRLRHIQFGHQLGWIIRPRRVTRADRRQSARTLLTKLFSEHDRHARRCDTQGVTYLPLRWMTKTARARAIGNAVPLKVATALGVAVSHATARHAGDCVCGCGRPVTALANHARPACRKRMQRMREEPRRIVTTDAAGTVTAAEEQALRG